MVLEETRPNQWKQVGQKTQVWKAFQQMKQKEKTERKSIQ